MRSSKNKIFVNLTQNDNHIRQNASNIRVNRDYLMSAETATEFNTYLSFDPFATFNDLFAQTFSADGKQDVTPDSVGSGTPGVRSLFNKAAAVVIGAVDERATTTGIIQKQSTSWRISNNVPLMDNRESRIAIRKNSGCSVKELVLASEEGLLGRETYSYSDFMFCKYLGRLPNTYMVTLRRFPYPVDDFISSVGIGDERKDEDLTSKNTSSIGCMVTWMGTPGNDMSNILKYSVTMPFKEQTAKWEQVSGGDADSGGGIANAVAAAFDPTYRSQYMAGSAGTTINNYMGKVFPVFNASVPYPASQWASHVDANKAYGPVDAIKKTHLRGDDGIDFQQSISLTFDYELRSYNGINPRQAMLDLLSNILNVTYTTGTFWGGGYRGGGAHQNNIFANLNVFKCRGGFTDFIDAFAKDYSDLSQKAGAAIEANGGIIETLKKMANTLGGMLMSAALNKMGRPQKAFANSLLSPAPIGFWHVTIGNPHHPIMSMGNMILKNTTITHYGPLGLDDFPTGLKVVCELTRGKSRDLRDIEKLYMHGNDRIYSPMGPKIYDMYKHAKEYRSQNGGGQQSKEKSGNDNMEITIGNSDSTSTNTVKIENLTVMKGVLQKYFGHQDAHSILIAAMEQEMGAGKKKKKKETGGKK